MLNQLVRWAGCELGEMANAVIRQLNFEELEFEVALIGSMFKSGEILITPMRETVHAVAPKAKLIPTEVKTCSLAQHYLEWKPADFPSLQNIAIN